MLETFKEGNLPGVPLHLRNATSKLASQMGYGRGYSYDLDRVGNVEYMPEELRGLSFFS